VLLAGEGLEYHDLRGEAIELVEGEANYPQPQGVWHVGRELARAGQTVDFPRLLPIYARQPTVTMRGQ
jgi:hypothetical protein